MANETEQSAEIVQLRPQKPTQESERKWGKEVMKHGFCIMPSLIFRAQQRLGLNPTQLAVLMQLADYWWEKGRKPYPTKKALGERLGLGPRQVQRYIAELEMAGFLRRIERRAPHKGKQSNYYDLSGLVQRLQDLEPEFREVKEKTQSMRRQVSQKGGLKVGKKEPQKS